MINKTHLLVINIALKKGHIFYNVLFFQAVPWISNHHILGGTSVRDHVIVAVLSTPTSCSW